MPLDEGAALLRGHNHHLVRENQTLEADKGISLASRTARRVGENTAYSSSKPDSSGACLGLLNSPSDTTRLATLRAGG
jgi:hypothetical protein